MKKLLISLLFFTCVTNSIKAQTKEETITWLQEKLQKYCHGYGDSIRVKVTECSITFSYKILQNTSKEVGTTRAYFNQYHIFPTDGLIFIFRTGWRTWTNTGEDFIDMAIKGNLKRIRVKDFSETESLRNSSQIEIIPGEENLSDRLNKAVTHLATFCPKIKETF